MLNNVGNKTGQSQEAMVKKINKFFTFAKYTYVIFFLIGVIIAVVLHMQTNAQFKKQYAINAEKIRAEKQQMGRNKKHDRELAQKKRLKELGINTELSVPTQKDDLLNAKLRERQEREKQELQDVNQQREEIDYQKKLAIYNAEVDKVKAEIGE